MNGLGKLRKSLMLFLIANLITMRNENIDINLSNTYIDKTLVDILFHRISPMVTGNQDVNAIEMDKPTGILFYIDFK